MFDYRYPKTATTAGIHRRHPDWKIDALTPFVTRELLDFPRNLKWFHYLELLLGLVLFLLEGGRENKNRKMTQDLNEIEILSNSLPRHPSSACS